MGMVLGLFAPIISSSAWSGWISGAPDREEELPAEADVASASPQEENRASTDALLRLLLRAENLLRIGKPDAAVRMLRGLSVEGHHGDDLLRLQSWALFLDRRHAEAAELLDGEDRLSAELVYLRGASRWRVGSPGALEDLRQLWWETPATVWGLASLRELASRAARDGGPYPEAHRTLILDRTETPDLDSAVGAERSIEATLTTLAGAHHEAGLLGAELNHAWGILELRREEFTAAAAAFRRAIALSPPNLLMRSTELHLAETLRRRGNYQFAMQRFERVASSGEDRLADRALASAGQMAIQHRRYDEARTLFERALVRNPVGPARHYGLWGLGWIAFRTGDFSSAIQFFQTLELETPYGTLAPRARYWRGRSYEQQNELEVANAVMLSITEQFPVDYYAYRAAEWLGTDHIYDTTYPADPIGHHPRVTAASSLFRAGMPIRATKALKRALGAARELGPHELLQLEAMAYELQADRVAKRLRVERQLRFPLGTQARELIRDLYPKHYVGLLRDHGKRQRVDPGLLVAVARRESGFNPRAVSSVGAVGLLQLMPATAASLLKEDGDRLKTPQVLMDEELNAKLGSRYLGRMLRAFSGREEYALAAYNAGPGAVTRWRATRGDLPDDIFVEEIPYRETRAYVRRVLADLRAFRFGQSATEPSELPLAYNKVLAARLYDAPPPR